MNPDIPLQLLGGITAREFLRDYWQKKPLLVRQAIPDFESPIDADELAGLALAERVRDQLPNLRLQVNAGAGSFKSQFKKADKSGALYALILGDDELAQQVIGFKPLRGQGEQQTIAWDALAEHLATCVVQG